MLEPSTKITERELCSMWAGQHKAAVRGDANAYKTLDDILDRLSKIDIHATKEFYHAFCRDANADPQKYFK